MCDATELLRRARFSRGGWSDEISASDIFVRACCGDVTDVGVQSTLERFFNLKERRKFKAIT
jgi:hypothetical protein